MDMFRHRHIADHAKAVFVSYLFKDPEEDVARTRSARQLLAVVAAAGDEMQITAAVNPSETSRHGWGLYRFKAQTGNRQHPRRPPSETHGGMGHPLHGIVTKKQNQKAGHPAASSDHPCPCLHKA